MSAVESCRTAALGGYVDACDDCGQPALRADAEAGADQQHADHQPGGDRRPPRRGVERRQLAAQVGEVDKAADSAQQITGGDVCLERELVELAALLDLPLSHHLR